MDIGECFQETYATNDDFVVFLYCDRINMRMEFIEFEIGSGSIGE